MGLPGAERSRELWFQVCKVKEKKKLLGAGKHPGYVASVLVTIINKTSIPVKVVK